MTFYLKYFGVFVLSFVALVGGLLLLPEIGVDPGISFGEIGRLTLAFVVVAGGFLWYYISVLRHADNP